jgi:HTH domain found in ParB protein
MTVKQRHTNTNLLESIGLEILKADPAERLADTSLKIEYIPAELIRPDPIQPRRVLPEPIHVAFHANRLTPTQALRELIQVAQVAARQNGRPFSNVLDLVANDQDGEEDEGQLPQLSPEEHLIYELVNLAVTIRDDGQVNPLTVVDATQGVTRLYRIETGERRYWATWIVRDFLPGYDGDGTIPCTIIPSGKASIFRQAKENMARAGLSAIAQARQAALLILTVHSVGRPDGTVTNDFYRQALNYNLRDKGEFTADILAAMGGISRSYFSRVKALIGLSDEALELADRHELEEGQLRYVLALAPEDQVEVVRQIIDFRLTSRQVKALCEQNPSDTDETAPPITRPALQLARIIKRSDETSGQEVANALLAHEKNVQIARLKVQGLRRLLDEIEGYLK